MANGWYNERRRHSIAARQGARGRYTQEFVEQEPYVDRYYYQTRKIRRLR